MVPAQPRVNFFGFPKMMCPACQRTGTHPLSTARYVTYAVIGALAVVFTLISIMNGGLPIVGVIPALMIAALAMDWGVRQKFHAAKKKWDEQERMLPNADPKSRPGM